MQGGDEVSIEELASNLSLYKDQLHQVRQLLNDKPSNSEYVDMERELSEVIALTEELLATAKQNEMSGSTAAPNAGTSPSLSIHKENQMINFNSDQADVLVCMIRVLSYPLFFLPPILLQSPLHFCLYYDGWACFSVILVVQVFLKYALAYARYNATIEAYTPNGYYVSYDNWGNKEEVRIVKTT
ncbi:hypothetical protein V8G54_037993 (chloroplast) [Vigna mungo]|uniref:Tudor domain-containing protein n=1 Tax=Vigna mungo TaxID=3915 RepID=A0AAQ3MDG5_VIGMU